MPKQVAPLTVSAPGFYGLNKQLAGGILPAGWSTETTNAVMDELGRITSRKGSIRLNSAAFTGTARSIHEYTDTTGSSITIFAAGNKIYKVSGTSVVDITGTITTPTGDNWQFVNFNGQCYGVQVGHALIRITSVAGSFADVTKSGTQQPTTNAASIVSAYGRLWIIDQSNLKYSDLLDGTAWNGVFDLSKYWFSGADEGTAVTDFNGFLIVFGKNNLIVFNNPYDPASTMQIVESIGGIGCVARDTVQNVGTDLLFLSNTGVRSFGRTIQEKSMPVNDVTKNVRDYLLGALSSETKANIKSVYSPVDGFYLLSFPVRGITFCIDIRQILPDGSLRVTEWSIAPTALARDKNSVVYMGDASYVKKYDRYLDNVLSDASGGSVYEFKWTGGWTDINEQVSPFLKIPKRVTLLMGGVAGANATIRWWFDYLSAGYSSTISFPAGQISQYGTSQYGINNYSGDISFKEGQSAMASAGQVVKFGISTTVNGTKVVMQSFSIISKIGRVAV